MTTTITVVDGDGVQQTINSLPPLGPANAANSLPVISAGSVFTTLTANTAIDARSYQNFRIFCQVVSSVAYTIQYSADGNVWFNFPTTFGSSAGVGMNLSGGYFYKITAGTGGTFLYSLS